MAAATEEERALARIRRATSRLVAAEHERDDAIVAGRAVGLSLAQLAEPAKLSKQGVSDLLARMAR